MLVTRTPFRLPLGGGSTDLPSYYRGYGGFIFGVAINKYFDTFLRKRCFDNNIGFQWAHHDQVVATPQELEHNIGREALLLSGVTRSVEVGFQADTPSGTGLGSSGSCAVGLLNALFRFKGEKKEPQALAELAFQVTQKLGLPDGKQDPYIAALGGFVAFDVLRTGEVTLLETVDIAPKTVKEFLGRTLLFYTGIRRDSSPILSEQSEKRIIELKHRTLEIGKQVFKAFKTGDIDHFGMLMDEHWHIKRGMSSHMSNDNFDDTYIAAKEAGALGGKILGAGGGGYFMFCAREGYQEEVARVLARRGLHRVEFDINYSGTRVVFEE